MQAKRHSQGAPDLGVDWPDRRVNDALTDLSAYALTLEAEHHRLEDRLLELAGNESSTAERRAVLRERDEISEELNAFRRAVTALRDQLLRRPTVHD
jgi:hypothetical protein